MEPAFADGELALVEPVGVRRFQPVAAGDVVIARHTFKNVEVIKYVDEVHDDGYVSLRSPAGEDSRLFGRLPVGSIRGRVTANLTRRILL